MRAAHSNMEYLILVSHGQKLNVEFSFVAKFTLIDEVNEVSNSVLVIILNGHNLSRFYPTILEHSCEEAVSVQIHFDLCSFEVECFTKLPSKTSDILASCTLWTSKALSPH